MKTTKNIISLKFDCSYIAYSFCMIAQQFLSNATF